MKKLYLVPVIMLTLLMVSGCLPSSKIISKQKLNPDDSAQDGGEGDSDLIGDGDYEPLSNSDKELTSRFPVAINGVVTSIAIGRDSKLHGALLIQSRQVEIVDGSPILGN